MKVPRVKDFDPNAKVPTLKSSLDSMPSIKKPKTSTHGPFEKLGAIDQKLFQKTTLKPKPNTIQCAPKARTTSGGRFHPESCRLLR